MHRHRLPSADLEHCPVCRRDFVTPIEWEPAGEERWWMLLRCGECGVSREVTVPNAEAHRFERAVHARAAAIARELRRLEDERLEAEVTAFALALEHDLIDAGDFATL